MKFMFYIKMLQIFGILNMMIKFIKFAVTYDEV